ncbi:MAG: MotA/TolQ/ExbB proton channel family protein [Saprospiraceae bacterium]|nr:MotA/TolQ/ExbB proton channel family protein [Saprospiraceae bacterium]
MLLQVDSLLNPEIQETGTVQSTRIIDIIARMGPFGWIVMGLLFALLLMAVYILLERYFTIKKASKIDSNFMNKIRDHVTNGKLEAAKAICEQTNSPVARMIHKGVLRIGRPLKDINAAIENVGNLEVSKLEKNLPVLATIAGAAPMLGFLGTVTGMINAFYKLSVAGNNIDTSQLAGGIYEALFTTAFGLAVGILAYIGYNWLVSLLQKVIFQMEANSVDFIDLIQEPGR